MGTDPGVTAVVTYTVETLVHFRCGACQGWWSIGDAPLDRTVWYCPWCGTPLAVGHSSCCDDTLDQQRDRP